MSYHLLSFPLFIIVDGSMTAQTNAHVNISYTYITARNS